MSYKELQPVNHEVNITYQGTFSDLVRFLELKGIEFQIIYPGLTGSKPILTIKSDKTTEEAYNQG